MKRLLGMWAIALLSGCGDDPVPLAESVLAPMGELVPHATAEQQATFERGRALVARRFTAEDGLGPGFNLVSCGGCHERPVSGGSAGHYRDFLLVQQRLDDGSQAPVGVNGVQRQFDLEAGRTPDAEGANVIATRNPIPFFGVGPLAEIDEDAILENADPDDRDGDGVSGRPNYDRGFVGRFGRKAQTVSIEGFIRGPLFNHLGITSVPLDDTHKAALPVPSVAPAGGSTVRGDIGALTAAQAAAPDEPTVDDDGVPDPELSTEDLFDIVSFSMLLAAPAPEPLDDVTSAGRAQMDDMRCTSCHVPALRGPRGMVPAFSDLLLHDMGPDLADGIRMGVAQGAEFRTHPLWGVIATGPYLHDGRAHTLDEAIRAHGGEAAPARDAYLAASDEERDQLLAFLASLGGREKETPGLLPPGEPLAAPETYGGPTHTLEGDDLDRFTRGRLVFDRDLAITQGLGPEFNGDSCRACHFDPVIGGAGPADVNVMRGARRDGEGTVVAERGSMAHRLAISAMRPPLPDSDLDVFELRQTPPLFGLGLVDTIPDDEILAREDPDDADEDGISGRAHRLPDGRLGRLGWKANVPSLDEFSRDALSNELGVSVPPQDDRTFGFTEDGDDKRDPEISFHDLAALTFFIRSLAPPPRTRTNEEAEDRGEGVFEDVGCTTCHATLRGGDGEPVALYSDLLLHDVFAAGAVGVGDGDASGRELRTAPLWGLARSGPYMHDGRSTTIEDAIARHDGEARDAAERTAALSASEREALLAFLSSL